MKPFPTSTPSTRRSARRLPVLVAASAVFLGATLSPTLAAVGPGAAALLAPSVATELKLTPEQRKQIQGIANATGKRLNEARAAGGKVDVARIREAAQAEAVALLTPTQKSTWLDLVARDSATSDELAERSLIIPTIQQMRNPPSPNAYGSTAGIRPTRPHSPRGNGYVVLTDHTDPVALAALGRLAKHRNGSVVTSPSLGTLHQSAEEFARLDTVLRGLDLRFVAIAPRAESYRENMHLSVLRLLSSLDPEPGLDVFPGYLMADDGAELTRLVERTIAFRKLNRDQLKPALIGTIEDDGTTRYRSYQKAKVLQKMFAGQGIDSPAVIVVTNPDLTTRKEFPKLGATANEVAMLPTGPRQAFSGFSEPALKALSDRNVLFMFGHGMPDKLCGTKVSAFGAVDLASDLIFCGSCMSASPVRADRVNLDEHAAVKRFGSLAVEKGAVMVLGHMGLCGGFPEVYPMAEHVLEGLPVGEAYQRIMNSIMGDRPMPDYFPQPEPQGRAAQAANQLLLILWADPALVPIASN